MPSPVRYPKSNEFWSLQESFYRVQAGEADAKAEQVGTAPRMARKQARWDTRGGRYLRGQRVGASARGSLIRVDPHLSRAVLDQMDRVGPLLVAAIDRRLGARAIKAFNAWPVDTGLSKSLLDLNYQVLGNQLVATLSSRAPYTVFIKGQPHRRLIDRPSRAMVDGIVRDLGDELGKGG